MLTNATTKQRVAKTRKSRLELADFAREEVEAVECPEDGGGVRVEDAIAMVMRTLYALKAIRLKIEEPAELIFSSNRGIIDTL